MKALFYYVSFLFIVGAALVMFFYFTEFSTNGTTTLAEDHSSSTAEPPSQNKQTENDLEINSGSSHNDNTDHNEEPPPEEPVVTIERTRFAAIGDVIIYSSMLQDAKTEDGYDFRYMFDEVAPYLAKTDLLLANQESMIGGPDLGLSDYPMFNSPFEIADALKDVGVDVVNIANNHTLDRRSRAHEAIINATDHWNELGIAYTGAYRSQEDAAEIRVIERNGITFAFLGYTYGTNGIPIPQDQPWIVNLLDESKITADIQQAKEAADVVVVSYHFGNEYERMPNDAQIKWAELAADAGAHIVIGHHPHVLQPFTWLDRKDSGQTFVAYSLGNFLAAQDHVYRDLGGVVYVTVEKRTEDDKETIELMEPEFLPTWQHKPNWRDYRVIPLHDVTEEQLTGAGHFLQEMKTHVSQWMPELSFSY